jgi:Kef-type K+ transport system membrane component KefB
MSTGLVIVLAAAAAIPLLLGLMPRVPLPGPVLEIGAGVVIGPAVPAWVNPDETIRALSVLGLSFLLFLAGFEVDVRRFRGQTGRHIALALAGSVALAAALGLAFSAAGMRGGLLIAIALLATSLGLIVPVLGDAGVLHQPIGVLTVACASAGEVAAVVALSVGVAGSHTPLAGRVLLLGLLVVLLAAVAAVVVGAEHVGRITVLVDRLADTSAQIRIRLTVLLVAGIALAAAALGFEAILGAFMAGVLVRALDPEPERSHPRYPIKLEAVGFGLLIPVFFVTSGMTLDVTGLIEQPAALAGVPILLLALLIVRGAPTVAFRRELPRRHLLVASLLQATSLPFLLTVAQIGTEMGLLARTKAAALVAAGLVSVTVFPPVALRLLRSTGTPPLASARIQPATSRQRVKPDGSPSQSAATIASEARNSASRLDC